MKYFKNVLLAATLAVASLGLTSFSANAVLITQDIDIVDDPIFGSFNLGSVTIDIDDSLLGNGDVSVFGYVELVLLGVPDFVVFDFEALVDGNDVFAGIEFLAFDVEEDGFDFWSYQAILDAADPLANFIDIFNGVGDPILFSADVRLGSATFVPEPSTVALFGLALVAMGFRRRVR